VICEYCPNAANTLLNAFPVLYNIKTVHFPPLYLPYFQTLYRFSKLPLPEELTSTVWERSVLKIFN
jgi:hypothetical protein